MSVPIKSEALTGEPDAGAGAQRKETPAGWPNRSELLVRFGGEGRHEGLPPLSKLAASLADNGAVGRVTLDEVVESGAKLTHSKALLPAALRL